MWRFYNRIFGWYYVLLFSRCGNYRHVQRVRRDASGRMYVEFLGVLHLSPDGTTTSGYQWTPLTWNVIASGQTA